MELVMHYPDTEEKQKELERRVAALHAEAVIDYINALPCAYVDKLNFIELIKKSYQRI